MRRSPIGLLLWSLLILAPAVASAQTLRGLVVDQTGLPLPGALLQLHEPDVTTAPPSVTSGPDGTFEFAAAPQGATIVVSLDGFETVTVPPANAARIVLPIARANVTTDVVGSAFTPAAPTTALLGSTLTATNIARLPSAKLKAKDSLPLLPSVVRGPDGLLQLGGARPHDSPVFLDGFNITDPATGTSSINLPFEAVRGIEAMRDPMAVTFGGLLGGLVQLDSKPGGDRFAMGVQGFIPRPRFNSPGFGRLEGIFPRVFANGPAFSGRARYFLAAEYDYERIPVPGVTRRGGPDVVERSTTLFGRVDVQASPRDQVIVEGLTFPSASDSLGLSPLREEGAAPNLSSNDLFGGVTVRHVFEQPSVLTVRISVFDRQTDLAPAGTGAAYLTPAGWQGNSFSSVNRRAIRQTMSAMWERTLPTSRGSHDLSFSGGISLRHMNGSVAENAVFVQNTLGQVVRTVEFGPRAGLAVRDQLGELALRDVWRLNDRLQIDTGGRLDQSNRHGAVPSARLGVRYTVDESGATVIKGGVGHFVNTLPLAVEAFSSYPARIDRQLDPVSGNVLAETTYQPTVDRLRLPRALAATLEVDRQLFQGLDVQVSFTSRHSSRLATLHVPVESGPLTIRSSGTSQYRDLQVSVRRQWKNDQQVFVSYVVSSAFGERNDFATLFHDLDRAVLQPGGMSRLSSDARHRWLGWGTFNLPAKVVISPVVEWRSGFPYSIVDEGQRFVGVPNSHQFPAFAALDMVVYKTFERRKRKADFGVQLFNTTHHFNPRDVYSVAGASRFGSFTNSVGTILRGFMLIKW